MGGAFIECIGNTEEEVKAQLTEAKQKANDYGLTDLRAEVVEENWPYKTDGPEVNIAPWGGMIWIHS